MANLQAIFINGWSPELARATTVGITGFQVVGWIGGNGTAPVTGQYVGTANLVTNITDMANFGAGGIANINVSAGTTSNNLTNLIFSNSNGVSFGLNNSTITAAVPAQSSVVFSNSNNVSFTLNAGTINASASFPAQTSLAFSNSNGVSFGINAGTLTATVATNYQSQGAYLTTAMQSDAGSNFAGTNSAKTNATFTFNSNGLSFNGVGYAGTGTSATNASITLDSNGLQISVAPPSAGGLTAINVSAGASSSNVSAVTFNNSNGVSFGYDGTNITATVATNYQSQGAYLTTAMQSNAATISNINVSASNTSANLSNIVFSNSNGVTFGLSGSTITASVPAGVAATSWTVSDAATSATVGRLAFTNSNGLTLSLSTSNNGNHTVIGSYTVPTVTNSSWTVSDANTSQTIAQLAFTNSNGLTLSLSTSNNGHATVIGSYTVPNVPAATSWTVSDAVTSQTIGRLAFTNANGMTMTLSTSNNGNATVFGSYTVPTVTNSSWTVSDANTSQTIAQLAFTNSNGLTLSLSTSNNGHATVIGSYTVPNVPAQTVQTLGIYGSSQTTGSASSATYDARSLSIIGAGIVSIGNHSTSVGGTTTGLIISATQSNQAFSAQGGSSAFQTLIFTNSNGFSFSNTAGSIWGSYTVPTLTNSSMSVTADNGSSLGSLSQMYFKNGNGVSFGLSTSNNGSATLTASVNQGGASNLSITAGNASSLGSLSQLYFSNANAFSFGLSTSNNGSATLTGSYTVPTVTNSSLSITAGNGTSIGSLSQLYFSNANNISFGLSTSNNGSATLTASASVPVISMFGVGMGSSTGVNIPLGFVVAQPVIIPLNLTASVADLMCSFSMTTSGTNNTTYSGSFTFSVGIYSMNANTLSLASSGSQSYTYSYTSTQSTGLMSGVKRITVPININATPGQYWTAMVSSYASGSGSLTCSFLGNFLMGQYLGSWGQANASSVQFVPYGGVYSTTTNALPANIGVSDMFQGSNNSNTLSLNRSFYVMFRNISVN